MNVTTSKGSPELRLACVAMGPASISLDYGLVRHPLGSGGMVGIQFPRAAIPSGRSGGREVSSCGDAVRASAWQFKPEVLDRRLGGRDHRADLAVVLSGEDAHS